MLHRRFEEVVLPHLDAAFNYARWLTKNEADAEDVVQDASVRALRFFSSLRAEDARAWLLTIVRNTWYGRFPRRERPDHTTGFDEKSDDRPDEGVDPEALLMQQRAVDEVRAAIEQLPVDFREVIVLRELEGLSYKEIAAVIGIPMGTVMSRLARARESAEVGQHLETCAMCRHLLTERESLGRLVRGAPHYTAHPQWHVVLGGVGLERSGTGRIGAGAREVMPRNVISSDCLTRQAART
jgi:RNA polymerase sigma factor (sigma-70 family)